MIIEQSIKNGLPFYEHDFPKGTFFTCEDKELYVVINDWHEGTVEVYNLNFHQFITLVKDNNPVYHKVTKLLYEI